VLLFYFVWNSYPCGCPMGWERMEACKEQNSVVDLVVIWVVEVKRFFLMMGR